MLAHIHTREGERERERPGNPCFFLSTQNFAITLTGIVRSNSGNI